ncbi:hypothetical protein AUP68_03687 [Ilyonectria robusta]
MSILSMVSGGFKSSMTFWAVVPYAVSLTASTAYRTLRNTTVQYKHKQVYTMFYRSCDTLDDLSKSFLSAQAMARLTRNALEELKRVSYIVKRSIGRPSIGTICLSCSTSFSTPDLLHVPLDKHWALRNPTQSPIRGAVSDLWRAEHTSEAKRSKKAKCNKP